jgi:hypothetical protein
VSTPGFIANTGGLTALTISATTYLNLPSATFTGGTVSGPTNFTGGLTANTISATTYQNLPNFNCNELSNCDVITGLTGDVQTIQSNISTIQGDITTIQGEIIGTPQQIAYYNASGNLTGDTSFTRQDETGNYETMIGTINSLNLNEYQNTVYNFTIVRDRVYDEVLFGETSLNSQSFISKIENATDGTTSSLEILESSGSFKYADNEGYYNGFFYNDVNPGWYVSTGKNQKTYNLPTSGYIIGSVLTDVNGDGNLSWTVPTSSTFTGGTVSGPTNFTNGLTSNTISATTYQNLPETPFLPLSGGTVSGTTRFISGLTANTISATTYQNLPTSITSVTESANVITVVNSNGQSAINTIDAVTGGTYSAGQITLSGTGNVNGTQISTKILPVALTVVSSTASTNASLSSLFTLTLTGNTTLDTPTNGFSGQRIVYRLRQDGTGSKLLTLSSGFRSGPITVTLSTAANTTDYLGVIYNEIDNVWDVLALNKGYS